MLAPERAAWWTETEEDEQILCPHNCTINVHVANKIKQYTTVVSLPVMGYVCMYILKVNKSYV